VTAAIIEVPAMAGDAGHAAASGPAALTRALAPAGHPVPVERVAVPTATSDARGASAEVALRVARAVRAAVGAGRRPLVLAGSCDVAPAVIAGLGAMTPGVIWIDAHADFNTPASSTSGFWPGMTLACVVGDCGEDLWARLGGWPVPAERVVLLGVRDLSPAAERERLAKSAVRVVGWRDGEPEVSVRTALDDVAGRTGEVYVHLDLDVLDPAVGAGVVDPPVPGGLSARQLDELLEAVQQRFAILGATVATYVPEKDDGSTLRVAVAAAKRLLAP